MKRLLTPAFCLALLTMSSWMPAQVPPFLEWAHGWGGTTGDFGKAVAVDAAGNSYSVGDFSGTVDFDPGPGTFNLSSANSDTYILKFDPAGNFVWAKQIQGSGNEYANHIALDRDGNIFVTGYFGSGSADFDPGVGTFTMTPVGASDHYILKLNAAGDFLWSRQFGGSQDEFGFALAFDTLGNVYSTGSFSGTADFDPGAGTVNLSAAGSEDIFVSKLSASGNYVWAKRIGGASFDRGYGIQTDVAGNCFLTGYFGATVDFDPGAGTTNLSSFSGTDGFVLKLDAAGNFVWAQNTAATRFSIARDPLGNIYTCGQFSGTQDFDPGNGVSNLAAAGFDAFVTKVDGAGNFLWAQKIGGASSDGSFSIDADAAGNVYVAGFFRGTVDFDPGAGTSNLTSLGDEDAFICKFNNVGSFQWVARLGGTGKDNPANIDVDAWGSIYTIGFFNATADFDPGAAVLNLTSNGGNDAFLHKLGQCVTSFGSISPVACDSYLSPSGNQTWTVTGTYLDTLPNARGCDSIITINLTVNNSSTGSETVTACGPFTWAANGATYNVTGTHTASLLNAAGCDSVVTLNLTIISANINVTQTGNTLSSAASGATYQWLDCNNGNLPIAGATAGSFTPTVTGNYAVIVTENGCTDTSNCILVVIVGLEKSSSFGFQVLGNPETGELRLTLSGWNGQTATLDIVNLAGVVLYHSDIASPSSLHDISNLASGMYLVRVATREQVGVQRLSIANR
jgi:Beta-propeller repeat